MGWRLGVLGAIAVLLSHGVAWAAEPVAVLTEIRPGQGAVQVKLAGEADWKAAQPLSSLRPGDQVRAAGDGQAVVVFTGGRGPQTISQANSPFSIQAPTVEAAPGTLRALLASVTQFLLGQQKELTYRSLSARNVRQPPLILTPRETRLFPGPVTFEWAGPEHLRYRVRVLGPQGPVWEVADLPRQPLAYPPSEPALRAGVRYAWELEAWGEVTQRAQFEILPAPEADRVKAGLALLEPAALWGYPRTTVALMRAGFLLQEGLHHEARRELLDGMAADPDEPTLHLLLGQVYERIGLNSLAAAEFDEAQFLLTRRP